MFICKFIVVCEVTNCFSALNFLVWFSMFELLLDLTKAAYIIIWESDLGKTLALMFE